MGNLHQNMCLSSPDQNTWSEETLKRPPSPSLLQSCYQEMERKGLGLYSRYQNFPAASDATKTSASCLESRNHRPPTNKNDVPDSPPIPCVGRSLLLLRYTTVTFKRDLKFLIDPKKVNKVQSTFKDFPFSSISKSKFSSFKRASFTYCLYLI